MSLIKIENASLGYEGKTVVNDISVDIKEKDYICIVGENGSGKTTLMKGLLGLLKPLSGSITYSDGLKQNEIGYLPQSSDIQRDFPASVQEVVLSGCLNKKHTFFYSKEQKKTAAENMKLTGIYDLRKKCFRELSGGQRQRVMLARALCATHKLIILDEPVTGLDPMAMADMYALIKKLNESGITIIMVSHDVNSAVSNASKIGISTVRHISICIRMPANALFSAIARVMNVSTEFTEVLKMFDMIFEMFSYNFIVRAFIVGTLVSLCAALLGVTLVLKRYSMIGDGLSHVGFGALAVAAALNLAPLEVAVPVIIIAAFLLLRLSENSKINGDAAIAIISSTALAIGVVFVSVSGVNTDLNSYLFGSILATTTADAIMCGILALVVIVIFILFYNKIFAVTFDETFSRATGLKTGVYNTVIALLTALTIVIGMRIMGTLLISALIIFPALSSMRVCKKFKSVILCSGVLSLCCFFVGMCVSYSCDTPTGASVVIVNAAVFLIFRLVEFINSKIRKNNLN